MQKPAAPTAAKPQDVVPAEKFDLGKVLSKLVWRFSTCFLKASPPEPCPTVANLLKDLNVSNRELHKMYDTFHRLRLEQAIDDADGDEDQGIPKEDVPELIIKATSFRIERLERLLTFRKKWVVKLLRELVALAELTDEINWDQFLCLFIRFGSLNRTELAQALFLIIKRKSGADIQHYLTVDELQTFYYFFKECTVRAFNTKLVDFERLPLRRYYASDFAELVQRYAMLLNPILFLQQQLQAELPNREFWERSNSNQPYCRKITSDFFCIDPVRVYLRGEPPFKETCEMLLPDSLGFEPMNQDQWLLRTRMARDGLGLHQSSVWGEHMTPEEISANQDEVERHYLWTVQMEREAQERLERELEMDILPVEETTEKKDEEVDDQNKDPEEQKPLPSQLALAAAMMDEMDIPPGPELPPKWMDCATIAPAPQLRAPDRPIRQPILAKLNPVRAREDIM